jgi:hypothetical protein
VPVTDPDTCRISPPPMRPMGFDAEMNCSLCEDCGWVCENHPEKPWETAASSACSILIAKTSIGVSGSWRGTNEKLKSS